MYVLLNFDLDACDGYLVHPFLKTGSESSLFHIATIHNSRQAYASFLN